MSDPIRPTDEGIEGGLYIDERGFWINAKGEYVDENGKASKTPIKAPAPKLTPMPPAQPAQPAQPDERVPFAATPTKRPDEK